MHILGPNYAGIIRQGLLGKESWYLSDTWENLSSHPLMITAFIELAWVGWSRKLVTKHFTEITSLFLQWHSLSFLCSSPRDGSVAKERLRSHTPFIVPQLSALMLTLFCQLVELLQYGELAYCILHARCSQYVAVLQYIQM